MMFITFCLIVLHCLLCPSSPFPRLPPNIIFKRKKGKKESRQTDYTTAQTKRKNDLMEGLWGNRSFTFFSWWDVGQMDELTWLKAESSFRAGKRMVINVFWRAEGILSKDYTSD